MGKGPLDGLKVIELAGIGPAPFCATLLADMGAEVIRVDRTEPSGLGIAQEPRFEVLGRGRRNLAVNLKNRQGAEVVLRLAEKADALIEGFRPGVAERLGVGPEDCFRRNPKLVYGRMTGFGQDGPMAHVAGHDINYIALAGVLNAFGRAGGPPVPPLNLVGDFGGGGMFLAFGVMAALWEAQRSGQGQVVDAAMVEGAAYLGASAWGLLASGFTTEERGTNVLDTGSHFYEVYECADGKYVSIGSIEPKFYALLLEKTGVSAAGMPKQMDRDGWPVWKAKLGEVFRTKTRDEWCRLMEDSDVCFAPVLSFSEAPDHPHNRARDSFIEVAGVVQPAPAPKFSRSGTKIPTPTPGQGANTEEVLRDWGFSGTEIGELKAAGAVRQA